MRLDRGPRWRQGADSGGTDSTQRRIPQMLPHVSSHWQRTGDRTEVCVSHPSDLHTGHVAGKPTDGWSKGTSAHSDDVALYQKCWLSVSH